MKIEIRKIKAGYPGRDVIKDVSLTIKSGELFTLIGANGEGKTTLIKVLCGLKKPKKGEILINERDITSYSPKELSGIMAYVPQTHQLGLSFSVLDMTLLGCVHNHGLLSNPDKKDYLKAYTALEELGIDHLATRSFTALSGGEQRLVLLARALTQNAKFIVLDEPVSNLDLGNQIKVLKVLDSLSRKGIGIIFSSHFPEHSLWLNCRTAVLKNGEIIANDSAANVINSRLLSDIYDTEIAVHHHNNGTIHLEPQFIKELLA